MNKTILAVLLIVSWISFKAYAQEGKAVLERAGQNTQEEKAAAQSPDQKMNDFSLSGYTQQGKKSWEIKGDSADIFSDVVKLNSVDADLYGEKENVNLVADKGEYDKNTGNMHLEDNVVINTDTGASLTTDSLDWDRTAKKVTTDDPVSVKKENITADGKGLEGQTDLKKVYLKDDVQVHIEQESGDPLIPDKEPIVITCTGPLEVDYDKQIAVFNNNVKAVQADQTQMYADKMEVYFDFNNKKILRAKAIGNVKIVKGENVSYSDEANYVAQDKKMVLTGRPRVVIYSKENIINAPSGN